MFELLDNALKALAAYPPLAALAGLLVIGGGVWLMVRGERDRKTNGTTAQIPAWMLYGPAHDAMASVHQLAEQGRVQIHILERMEVVLKEIAREQLKARQALEMIRNESRLR